MHVRNLTLMAAALVLAACDLGDGGFHTGQRTSTRGPVITAIPAVTVNQDTTALVPLSVTDGQADLASLSITATAADGTLVLPQGITITRDNGVPTLHIQPAEAATGSTQILVSVTDPSGGKATQSFTLTVTAVDVAFSALAQQVLARAGGDPPVTINGLTVIQDADDSTAFDALFD